LGVPWAFLEKIPTQEKRPPGDLPRHLRNARDRHHTSQDGTKACYRFVHSKWDPTEQPVGPVYGSKRTG
jgi:hypothetical protein